MNSENFTYKLYDRLRTSPFTVKSLKIRVLIEK